MRWITLILCLASAALSAAPADFPAQDARALRELQAKMFGKPSFEAGAARPEALLALAELGGGTRGGGAESLNDEGKAALFSLLQRYRDELLALGMDVAELDAQLRSLESRSHELERRLGKLFVKDGLKIHGRFYTFIDDLHLLGNASLGAGLATNNGAAAPAKTAYEGVRWQLGGTHGELRLEGTRGPAFAMAQIDVVAPFGNNGADVGLRRAYVEFRSPLTVQAGDIDAALSPLTLWRYESEPWFEPEPLRGRRNRARADMLLVKDKWHLSGFRFSSELHIFDTLRLDLQSVSAFVANPANVFYSLANGKKLATRYSTYMQGWTAAFDMDDSAVRIGYNGNIFWDVTSTNPSFTPGTVYSGMQETVQSIELSAKFGALALGAEAALSSYTAPRLTWAAEVSPLTGTAMIASVQWAKEEGYVKVFGRSVSSRFHAAGAQGRTVDADYLYLGPFLNDQSQVGKDGIMGLSKNIKMNHASILNDRLIPPGSYYFGTATTAPAEQHLLSYSPGEGIDANGQATPNRAGYGLELQWAFFDRAVKPLASYENFQHQEIPLDSVGNTVNPFIFTRTRIGLELDLEPWTGWPIRFGGGSTATENKNNTQDAAGKDYLLKTATTDASVQLGAGRQFGLDLGYRQMAASGQDFRFTLPGKEGQIWDIQAIGGRWRPQKEMSVDLVYSVGHNATVGVKASELEIDQVLLRFTTEF